MVNHVLVACDSISNKFTFARKHQACPNDFTTKLSGVTSCNFLEFKKGTDINITHEGIKSIDKIMSSH